ncbi:retinol dehydrogenase 8-like [Lytechinus pictus]|uniref:retinol dehydrogenase 8-like n=1 Tax=Lytechinus pictus TaxID=7653 RepID=UPI0030B9B36F
MSTQVVLMTGCSAGIGLVTAKRLALEPNQRYVVIATVIAMSEKTDLVAAVGDALNKTIFIEELDVTKDCDITTVVDKILKSHGRIDILLNIAGIALGDIAELVTRDMIEKIFNVNVFGPMRLTQAVLPQMKQRKSGKIISMSSTAGRNGVPYMDMYSSTKFALEGFFEALAVSLRAFNIRICLVEPGPVRTALRDGVVENFRTRHQDKSIDEIDTKQLQRLLDNILTEKGSYDALMPEDVAKVIVTRCVEPDEPVLRHLLIPEDLNEVVRIGMADLTGEKTIENAQQSMIKVPS